MEPNGKQGNYKEMNSHFFTEKKFYAKLLHMNNYHMDDVMKQTIHRLKQKFAVMLNVSEKMMHFLQL